MFQPAHWTPEASSGGTADQIAAAAAEDGRRLRLISRRIVLGVRGLAFGHPQLEPYFACPYCSKPNDLTVACPSRVGQQAHVERDSRGSLCEEPTG